MAGLNHCFLMLVPGGGGLYKESSSRAGGAGQEGIVGPRPARGDPQEKGYLSRRRIAIQYECRCWSKAFNLRESSPGSHILRLRRAAVDLATTGTVVD